AQLQRSSEASGQSPLPAWLASHPYPEERIVRIQQALDTLSRDLGTTNTNVDAYVNRIDGLVYGDDPRNGYFTGSQFLHPELRFRISFPDGWRTQNLAQSVSGVSGEQDAIMQLTLAEGTHTVAADRFFGGQGVSPSRVSRTRVNGHP